MANTRPRASRWKELIWIGLGLLLSSASARAQPVVSRDVTAAGGGTSSAGPYVLVDTIGQPEAGPSSSLIYTVTAGFLGTFGSPPTVSAPSLATPFGQNLQIPVADLLAGSDADGEPVSLLNVSASSANGGSLLLVAGVVTYLPPIGFRGIDSFNYTIADTSGDTAIATATVNVTIGVPVVTWNNPAPIAYGTVLTAVQLDAAANVSGTFTYNFPAGAVLPVGTATVSAVFTPNNPNDYTSATNTVSIIVTPATLTVAASPQNKPYGQTLSFGSGSTLFLPTGLQNGDTIGSITLAVSGNGGAATAAAGGYTITPSAATGGTFKAANYSISYATGLLTVTPATLLVTASPQSKTYGQALAFGSGSTLFTSHGLQNGETMGSVTLAVSGNGGAASASVTGSPYTITPSAATGGTFTLANYAITYAPGTLAVSPAPLTVTANNRTKAYGQSVIFAGTEFATSGLVNGDIVASVTLNSAGAVATATVAGSPYAIIPSAAVGPGLDNYSIAYANGTLVVAQASPVITWTNPAPVVYGAVLDGNQLNATTSVAGSFAYTPTNGSVLNAGTNVLSVVFTPTDASDYGVASNLVNWVVLPAPVTVTAANASRTYGQANPLFNGTIMGLTNGDAITVNYGCGATSASPVGTYPIVPGAAVGSDLTNYTITYFNGLLSVAPADLTITANHRNKTYGQAVSFAGTEFGASGLLNGDTVLSVTLTSAGASASATVSGSPYAIVPSAAIGTGLGNYTITYANGALVVNSASLTITANNRAKFYGQTVTFGGTEFSVTGLLNGDSAGSATLNSVGAAASATVAGSPYLIIPSAALGNGLGNYTITYLDGSLTVSPGTPVISWTNPPSITYGAALGTGQLDASANVSGNFVYNPPGGTVLNSGSNTLSVMFAPADPADYLSVTATAGLVVAPAPLTVTAASYSRIFDTANPIFSGVINGLTNNDLISATYTCAVTLSSPAGSYPIVPSLVDPNNRQTNYTVTLEDGALVVGRATETINWPQPAPIVYGTPLSGTQLNASVNLPGSFAYLPTNGSVLNTGTNTLTVVFMPEDPVDYGSVTNTVNLVVLPAPLSVTAANTNRAYGQVNPTFSGTITGLTNGDAITVSYSCSANSGSPVGTYPIVPDIAGGSNLTNYSITYANGALTVEPAALTLTANNRSKIFGQTVTFAGTEFSASGLLNGDTVTSVTLTSAGAAAGATVAGSPYAIVPSAAVGTGLGNYNIAYINGLLTVTGGGLAVTWANPNPITYGAPLAPSQLDATANVAGNFAYTPTNGSVLNSGTNTLTAVFTPNDLVDYKVVTNTVQLVINPASLSITAANANRVYGQANPSFTTILVGLTNGDSITAGATSSATAASGVGNYNIVPSPAVGRDLTNYSITYANGALTVEPAALTLTANNRSKIFGQTVTFAGTEFSASGLLNGDTVTSVTLTSAGAAAGATVAGSPYAIVPSAAVGTGLGNYNIAYINGLLTVTGGGLAVTWANPNPITYGAPLAPSQLDATANVAGNFAYIPTNGSVLNTGANTLTAIFTPNDTVDYKVVTNTVSLVVLPAPLTVTAADTNRFYGQANPIFSGTILGLTNGDNITATYNTLATSSSPPGQYPIVPSIVDDANRRTNYTITLRNGTLNVAAPYFSSEHLNGTLLQMVFQAGAGQSFALEWSTNLILWTPLSTNAANFSGVITFNDTPATKDSKTVFYRAWLLVEAGPRFSTQSLNGSLLQLILSAGAGQSYALDRSTNMVLWTPLTTNTVNADGTIIFFDTPGTNHSNSIFYRARLAP